jgi:5-(carboxyamino)imidazole ribonucleotide mutase
MSGPSEEPVVGIVMGSDSDWPVMEPAALALEEFDVPYEAHVVSAHRTPRRMLDYAESAAGRGLKVIIAGAGTERRPRDRGAGARRPHPGRLR